MLANWAGVCVVAISVLMSKQLQQVNSTKCSDHLYSTYLYIMFKASTDLEAATEAQVCS